MAGWNGAFLLFKDLGLFQYPDDIVKEQRYIKKLTKKYKHF